MTRRDRKGHELATTLEYHFGVTAEQVRDAYIAGTGVSQPTYYRHIAKDNYPDAEVLRMLTQQFGWTPDIYDNLMVEFGLRDATDEHPGINLDFSSASRKGVTTTAKTAAPAPTKKATTRPKLSALKTRRDAPPV